MFELVRKTPMPEYNGDALFYVHKETGMEVFHIKNSDAEMTCNFMFSTPSEDSKGVAHIIEHTVLCGSKRFPVKDPFSQVLLSSPNTFLNAITFCDKTMYPFSSPLKKDFDILFDIYADAVFAPLLRKQSFYQEGVRSFEGKFDGVVFNEMCGARSTEDSVVQTNSTKALFQGTPYEYDSGGDPYYIADLTYEEYVKRYQKWYSPTNCRLFLFGDLDTQQYLDKMENLYLKDCPKGEKIIPKSEYYMQKNVKPLRSRATCPAGDSSSVVMTWLTTPADDPLEILTVSILVDILLGNPGAPLYKAIIESGLGEDLNSQCGTDVDTPVLTFTAGFSHAKAGCEDQIEAFLLDQFKAFVRDGLPKDLVQAAIKRQEFRIQEIPGDGLPFGIATCLKAARSWMRGRNPEEGVANIARLEKLKAKVAEGKYFENWMQKNILENDRRCLLTVTSDPAYDDKFQGMLQAKLDDHTRNGFVATEEDQKAYEAFVNTKDSPEAIATIPRITVKDLPKSIPHYEQSVTKLTHGTKLYDYRLFTRGIVYITALFDTKNLNFEEKRLLPLMVRTIQMCGTDKHDYSQIGTLMKTYTGSFFVYPNVGVDVHQKPVSYVVMKTKTLVEDTATALDLIAEVLLRADMKDHARLKAALTDMITEFETGYTYSGNAYASMNAASVFSATALEGEMDMGTELWFFLSALKKDLESGATSYETLSASLTKLRDKVFTQKAMKVQIGSDAKDDSLVQIVSAFVDKFPVGK
ncbi:MAG: insulinase family protein, partial [Sphaerochaetaceae bacterium]|nr:insulinase family protein [Sphaerochaetaceae bacterium]